MIVNAADASVSALLAPLDLGDPLVLLVLKAPREFKVSLVPLVPLVLKVLREFRVSKVPLVPKVNADVAVKPESASA